MAHTFLSIKLRCLYHVFFFFLQSIMKPILSCVNYNKNSYYYQTFQLSRFLEAKHTFVQIWLVLVILARLFPQLLSHFVLGYSAPKGACKVYITAQSVDPLAFIACSTGRAYWRSCRFWIYYCMP